MSIMQRIFGAKDPASAPSIQNSNVQNMNPNVQTTNDPAKNTPNTNTQQTTQTSPNGVIPEGGGEKSPVEKFANIWETPKIDPNDPNKPAAPITAEQMQEAAGKIDFTRVLDQATLSKISAGGEDAVQAFATSLNKVAQTVFGQSAYAATKILEQGITQAEDRFAARLPTLINQQSSKDRLIQENQAFNSPAVKPIFDMVHSQLTSKFPNATSQEISDMTKEMLAATGSAFNPAAKVSATDTKSKQAEDWSSYM